VTLGAVLFWLACAIDALLMRLSPKYKASRFYDDCKRLHMKGDPEFNAIIREILLTQYGYKVEP
jgi:hypothetical protein